MDESPKTIYTSDKVIKFLIAVSAIAAFFFIIYYLKDALLPFFVAWLLAYMLNPIVKFLNQKAKIPHGISVIITLLSILGLITLIIVILVPMIRNEINQVNSFLANYDFSRIKKTGIPIHFADLINQYFNLHDIQEVLTIDNIKEVVQSLSPAFTLIVNNTVSVIVGLTVFFLVCLYLIFILLDYDKIGELWRLLIPPKYRPTVFRITNDVEQTMNSYFRHQFLICCILAILYSTGFQIAGFPLAIIFGLFVGFVHMIPYLQIITFPVAIVLCWLGSMYGDSSFLRMVLYGAGIYLAVQIINDLFLTPRIMGKAMGLNPAIILLSLSIWGSVLGIIGMIIALPFTTLLLSYYREFISKSEANLLENIIIKGSNSKKEEGVK